MRTRKALRLRVRGQQHESANTSRPLIARRRLVSAQKGRHLIPDIALLRFAPRNHSRAFLRIASSRFPVNCSIAFARKLPS